VTVGGAALPAPWRRGDAGRAGWSAQVAAAQALLVVAWLGCLVMWLPGSLSTHGSPGGWWCMPGMSAQSPGRSSPALGVLSGLPGWLLMSVAMTLAGVLPAAQHVAVNSFRRRRSMALCVFFAVYLLVWLAAGVPVLMFFGTVGARAGLALFTVSLALAAGYELTGVKRRALNRCHRTSRLPPSGGRSILAVGRFGWVNTSGCVASCWLSMIAMLVAGPAQPLVMVALTATTTYGRLARRPDRTRQRIAAGYAAGALLALALAI
jgi:hypothetical protein